MDFALHKPTAEPLRAGPLLLLCLAAFGCATQRATGTTASGAAYVASATSAGALEALRVATTDTDASVRAVALVALIQSTAEPGGGDWGPRATFDPSPWVQAQAVTALAARADDPTAQDHLWAVASRDHTRMHVRCDALRTLIAHDAARVADIASTAIDRSPASWAAAPCDLVLMQAGSADQRADAQSRLEATLRDAELPLELSFPAALGASQQTALGPALREAIGLVEEPLQIPLAAAALQLGTSGGEAHLRDALLGPDAERALEALDFLADLPADVSDPLIRRAATSATEPARTYAALIRFGRTADQGAVAETAIASPNRELRLLAARHAGRALAVSPSRRAARQIRTVLKAGALDPEASVRTEVARALASPMATPGDLTLLRSLEADPSQDVRLAVAAAALAHTKPVDVTAARR